MQLVGLGDRLQLMDCLWGRTAGVRTVPAGRKVQLHQCFDGVGEGAGGAAPGWRR